MRVALKVVVNAVTFGRSTYRDKTGELKKETTCAVDLIGEGMPGTTTVKVPMNDAEDWICLVGEEIELTYGPSDRTDPAA